MLAAARRAPAQPARRAGQPRRHGMHHRPAASFLDIDAARRDMRVVQQRSSIEDRPDSNAARAEQRQRRIASTSSSYASGAALSNRAIDSKVAVLSFGFPDSKKPLDR